MLKSLKWSFTCTFTIVNSYHCRYCDYNSIRTASLLPYVCGNYLIEISNRILCYFTAFWKHWPGLWAALQIFCRIVEHFIRQVMKK